jgi:hypothetical protein
MATTKLFRRRIDAMIYLRRPREPLRGGALLVLAQELHKSATSATRLGGSFFSRSIN